jgi:hypothetical protein
MDVDGGQDVVRALSAVLTAKLEDLAAIAVEGQSRDAPAMPLAEALVAGTSKAEDLAIKILSLLKHPAA